MPSTQEILANLQQVETENQDLSRAMVALIVTWANKKSGYEEFKRLSSLQELRVEQIKKLEELVQSMRLGLFDGPQPILPYPFPDDFNLGNGLGTLAREISNVHHQQQLVEGQAAIHRTAPMLTLKLIFLGKK